MKTTELGSTLYEEFDDRQGVYVRADGREIAVRFATVRAIGAAAKSEKFNQPNVGDRRKL